MGLSICTKCEITYDSFNYYHCPVCDKDEVIKAANAVIDKCKKDIEGMHDYIYQLEDTVDTQRNKLTELFIKVKDNRENSNH